MDTDKLVNFGTIKIAHGDFEAVFCIFFSEGSLSLYNKDFLQCFIIRKSSSGISISSWTNGFTLFNISYDIDGYIVYYPTR